MQPHEEWLYKAERDLLSAKRLFESGLNDTAIFHAQQCAEKSLKGFLAFARLPLQKSHDLVLLNNICSEYETTFQNLMQFAIFLNSRDIQFRYPSEILEPTHEEIVLAIKFAEEIYSFVKSLIQRN